MKIRLLEDGIASTVDGTAVTDVGNGESKQFTTIQKIIKQTGQINKLVQGEGKAMDKVPEVYDDGLKPVTKESGKVLALIPQTINAAQHRLDNDSILQTEFYNNQNRGWI